MHVFGPSGSVLRGFVRSCVFAEGSGAPKAVSLPGVECCGVDAALLWHPAVFLLPPLHPALQKQQVDYNMSHVHKR